MIKTLTGTDLASCKTRSGMASLSELLPRLIRSYELQAELMKRRAQNAAAHATLPVTAVKQRQGTFDWDN